MAKSGYVQIGIPTDMYEKIKNLIDEHTEYGYKTVPEFVKDAARTRMLQVKGEGKE